MMTSAERNAQGGARQMPLFEFEDWEEVCEAQDERFNKWKDFHRANPEVWHLFERNALEAAGSGMRNYGARAIMEKVRWDIHISTKSLDFKLNNNHIPFYARLFLQVHPEHAGFFRIRERK